MRWLTLVLLAACGPDGRPHPEIPTATTARTCTEDTILSLLNAPDTTAETLRDLGLRSSAAYHLMHTRSGADGISGTDDDTPFTSLESVDAVSYVGPATLDALQDWAESVCDPRETPALMMEQIVMMGQTV
ncbi:MAG: hypothetical protein ACI8RZ_008001 [Myxococcota bacterium]|jgi:hypothetical protein